MNNFDDNVPPQAAAANSIMDAINLRIDEKLEERELDFHRELAVLTANLQAALADFERKHCTAIDSIYLRREDHDKDGKIFSIPWGTETGKKYLTPLEGVDISCDSRRKLVSPGKLRTLFEAEKAEVDADIARIQKLATEKAQEDADKAAHAESLLDSVRQSPTEN